MSVDRDRIRRLWAEYSPRIEAAKKQESTDSTIAYVDLNEERILAIPAVVLTIERFLLLHQAGVFDNTCGEDVNQVLIFLWIVSPEFIAEPKQSKRFFRKHRKLDFLAYSAGIEAYVERMFHTTSGSKEGDSGKAIDWVGSIVDLIASEYGWKEEDILRIPIPRLLKYAAKIAIRHGGKDVLFISEADRLQAEFMDRANEEEASG